MNHHHEQEDLRCYFSHFISANMSDFPPKRGGLLFMTHAKLQIK